MMPILPTTITESGQIDERSQRRLVQYAIECGAAAVGHFGFASEFFKLSESDRRRITDVIVAETAGRVPVFVGVTAPSARAAIVHAKQAEAQGADLLMAAIPFVTVPDAEGVFDYYRAVAGATTLPLILQDTPTSAALLTAEMCARLAAAAPNILYVKAEGIDFLAKTQRILDLLGDRMQVIGGFGGKHMIHMLRLGVTSFMTGTEMLDLHGRIVSEYLAGRSESAASLYYERLLPYFVFLEMYPEELLKRMLHRRGVIDCPQIIPPRSQKPMSAIELRELDWVLERIGYDTRTPDAPRSRHLGDRVSAGSRSNHVV
jgi:4-hydroxy-tetrahydrodipicolinate synthase